MPAWYAYTPLVLSPESATVCRIHIGVGFCVARSDYSGQCEGLESWDE